MPARDILAAGTARIEELSGQPVVQAQMLDALGRATEQVARLEDAERMLRRALDLRRAQFGNDHIDVATSLINLSGVIRQRGKGEEAEQAVREAMEIQKRVLGPRHPDVATTMTTVAVLTDDASRAESLVRAARDIQLAAYGASHTSVTNTNAILADYLSKRGAHGDAEALLRENVTIRERLFGRDNPSTAVAMTDLARFLSNYRHRIDAADSLYTEALGIFRKQPPQYLVHVGGVLTGLTSLAEDRKDFVRAERYARESMELHRRTWGPDHPMSTDPMGVVAQQLYNQRRYAEADTLIGEALAVIERTVGREHTRAVLARTARGRTRAAMGRFADAEADFREAIAVAERTGAGINGRWVAPPTALLAALLARQGKTAEANPLFDRAAAILRPLPPQLAFDMKGAYAALADHYAAIGNGADAAHFRRLADPR